MQVLDSSSLTAVLSDLTSNIWLVPAGEWSAARQITSGKENGAAGGTTWTPDGRIVYRSRASGNPDIWIMDADGRHQKQSTDDAFNEGAISVTPDGRHIVFETNRSSTTQIWRTPVLITDKYAQRPAVSPDGKLIGCYCLDEETRATKIALLPFEGGEPVKLFDLPQTAPRVHTTRWTTNGRALTYINTRGIVSNIWLQPVDGGPPKQLTNFKTDLIFSFDWSRDGKWLAVSRGGRDSDVVLISSFR